MILIGPFVKYKKAFLVTAVIVFTVVIFTFNSSTNTINFSTQVKPIFNSKCISCHGGVKKQAGFSLLFREEALAKTKSGKPAIIPGDPDNSEMIRRLTLKDPEDRMPYEHEPLSNKEIDILSRWVKQGAKWGEHWAYIEVKETEIPKPKASLFGLIPAAKFTWIKNDIDYFIYDKIKEQKLQLSSQADKATLLRRVSLDITGLPPSASLAEKFFKSNDLKAYEVLVDSLLASPKYGERWTSIWLDLARYADSKGYERDEHRDIWRYRDWLIKAFNSDKKYDQFLTEQLAGDLMPNATDEQFIATAFNRNTMSNDEGGTDNEEFRTAAVIDRVNTTWQALMGTSFGCVQCHSHPYDPFKHDEYYQFLAFFNDTRDEDTYLDYPLFRSYSGNDSIQLNNLLQWLINNVGKAEAKKVELFLKTGQPVVNCTVADKLVNSFLEDNNGFLDLRNNGQARLHDINLTNKSQLIFRYQGFISDGYLTVHLDNPDGAVIKTVPINKTKDWNIISVDFSEITGIHNLFFTYTNKLLRLSENYGMQMDWFYFSNPLAGKGKPGYEEMYKIYWKLISQKNVPTTPVMMDNPADMHRLTNVFERGNWLVKGKLVEPGVPHSLNTMPKNAPSNRLGLAMWLTDKRNPLTARTMVNRLWEQLFGTGLVETLEDLGTQGAAPTHRELLDYLSYKFMHEYNWSVKKLLKEMVLSATYQQDSKLNKESVEKDPYNKWYARGARVRLSAEQIRDQSLAISGLLNNKMYGPSVMPWQPSGIWLSPYDKLHWNTDTSGNQYRRGLYTYIKRTSPYPSAISFDATGREVCTVRRIRTNTPLQALVLLNDSVYLEAARFYAYRILESSFTKDVKVLINKGYQLALNKKITKTKLVILENLYDKAYANFKNDANKTFDMVARKGEYNKPEIAALIVVTAAILNSDELIMKN